MLQHTQTEREREHGTHSLVSRTYSSRVSLIHRYMCEYNRSIDAYRGGLYGAYACALLVSCLPLEHFPIDAAVDEDHTRVLRLQHAHPVRAVEPVLHTCSHWHTQGSECLVRGEVVDTEESTGGAGAQHGLRQARGSRTSSQATIYSIFFARAHRMRVSEAQDDGATHTLA